MEETLSIIRHRRNYGQRAADIALDLNVPIRQIENVFRILEILDLPIPIGGESIPAVAGEILTSDVT